MPLVKRTSITCIVKMTPGLNVQQNFYYRMIIRKYMSWKVAMKRGRLQGKNDHCGALSSVYILNWFSGLPPNMKIKRSTLFDIVYVDPSLRIVTTRYQFSFFSNTPTQLFKPRWHTGSPDPPCSEKRGVCNLLVYKCELTMFVVFPMWSSSQSLLMHI